MGSPRSKTHHVGLDFLRVLAIIGVVAIHSVGNRAIGSANPSSWAEAIHQYCAFCVPVFVMISGAFAISDRLPKSSQEFLTFYKVRFSRILIPLLFWHLTYYLYFNIDRFRTEGITLAEPKTFLQTVYIMKVAPHLYFLWLIMTLYLLTPLLSLCFRHFSLKITGLITVIILVLTTLKPILEGWTGVQFGHTIFDVGFQTIGYYLSGKFILTLIQNRPQYKLKTRLVISSTLIFCAFIILGVKTLFRLRKIQMPALLPDDSYHWILTTISALCIFTAFAFFPQIYSTRVAQLVLDAARATMFVYLAHFLVMLELRKIIPQGDTYAPAIALVITTTLAISYAVGLVLKRIPYLRRIA
ncbi:acyltransferase [Mobiluncus curtisii]|nr:acyltransferase [Mobiluncus curtisii]